jgi:hypothetical protein
MPAVLNAPAIEKDQSQASVLYEILRLQVLGFHRFHRTYYQP